METGRLGLKLSFMAILLYLVCYFGSIEALLILCGFFILVEKNEWLNRQAFQAITLKSFYCFALEITKNIFSWIKKYPLGSSSSGVFINDAAHVYDFLIFAYEMLLLIGIFIALVKAHKGEKVDIPFVSDIVKKMMCIKTFEVKAAPENEETAERNKQNEDGWFCSQCGKRNTTDFCIKCGTKKRTL